ncbi:sterol desaturase family protein [bacterium]|jgi:sterol desaturase/sphingolipid hydroxylase (fatty acid hydroxylase superfamily)|nr:sterol desaturase family protein [bacterium]
MEISTEVIIRLGGFLTVLIGISILELVFPRQTRKPHHWRRWWNNLGLSTFNSLLMRFVFPCAAVCTAIVCEQKGTGLFYQISVSSWVHIGVSLLLLDLAIYWQHVLVHKVPFLWRFHKVHHADTFMDVSTGTRFHTIEILTSMGLKLILVALIGVAPIGVLLFELGLNLGAMFNHSNIHLPYWIDRVLRLIIVTPDMHRIHHSVHRAEHDSNYGFNLSLWDYLFRTYTPAPKEGQEKMAVGLHKYRSHQWMSIWPLFTLPFRKPDSE